jgi:hypothetical protein
MASLYINAMFFYCERKKIQKDLNWSQAGFNPEKNRHKCHFPRTKKKRNDWCSIRITEV